MIEWNWQFSVYTLNIGSIKFSIANSTIHSRVTKTLRVNLLQKYWSIDLTADDGTNQRWKKNSNVRVRLKTTTWKYDKKYQKFRLYMHHKHEWIFIRSNYKDQKYALLANSFFFSKKLFINIIISHSTTTDVHLQNDIFAIVGNYKTIKNIRLPSITSRVDLIYKERAIPCTYKCKYTRVDYNM